MAPQPCSRMVQAMTPSSAGVFSQWFSSSDEMRLTLSQPQPECAPHQTFLSAKAELDAYAQEREADSYLVQNVPAQY